MHVRYDAWGQEKPTFSATHSLSPQETVKPMSPGSIHRATGFNKRYDLNGDSLLEFTQENKGLRKIN